MKTVNGYLENGRFMPLEVITFLKRVPAVLVYNEVADDGKEARMAWLKRLYDAVADAADEEMPEFPRSQFNRGLIDFSDGV